MVGNTCNPVDKFLQILSKHTNILRPREFGLRLTIGAFFKMLHPAFISKAIGMLTSQPQVKRQLRGKPGLQPSLMKRFYIVKKPRKLIAMYLSWNEEL